MNEQRFNHWKKHVDSWKSEGILQAEYCKRNNLDQNLFSKWKIKITGNKNSLKSCEPGFVKIVNSEKIEKSGIKLFINDKYHIILQAGFNKDLLKDIISVLE